MQYYEIAPSYPLNRYIKAYWFLEGTIPAGYLQPERIFPDGCMELIIHYGDAFHKVNKNNIEKQLNSFVYGQLEEYIELLPSASTGVMGIKFYPQGLSHFTDVPVNEFKNLAIGLSNIFKNDCRQLEAAISDAKDATERVAFVERFLYNCLKEPQTNNGLVNSIIADIYKSKGNITIAEIVQRYKTGERQVERLVTQSVGLSPKLFSRIVRFQQVFNLAPAANNLTGLALEAGYFDQAHFSREFKSFTGLSPRQFFKGQFEFSSYFLDD